MNRARRRLLCTAAMLAAAPLARAQKTARLARIGYFSGGTSPTGAAAFKALVAALATLGWREGHNLAIEARYVGSGGVEVPAAELVRLRPDVIVSVGPAPTVALKKIDSGIPVVFAGVADPIGLGLVTSLARPAGNFTGLATLAPEYMLAKQVELLRETVPRASRIAFLTNPGNPVHAQGRELRLRVARNQGLEVVEVAAATRDELPVAFAEAARKKADVMYLSGDPLPLAHAGFVAELAMRYRLPVMFLFHQHVEAGGLMSYGVDLESLLRRAASYVDKILTGASAGDLPIEEPARYMLVINMTTAKKLGLVVPQSVLARADEVIQ